MAGLQPAQPGRRGRSGLLGGRAGLGIDAEVARIREAYDDAPFETMSVMLDRQFDTLHRRAHVLLVVCSLLVTGNAILSYSSETALVLVLRLAGGALAIGAAAVAVAAVMRIVWMTRFPGDTREEWLRCALHYRNKKTAAYRVACWMTLASMLLYEASVAALLFATTGR